MALTIRTKLTLWYTTLLTISILLLGIIFTYTLLKKVVANADSNITSVAEMMAESVLIPPRALNLPKHFDIILERFFGIKIAGNYVQIIDAMGHIEAKSSTLKEFNLPLSRVAYNNAFKGKMSYEMIKDIKVYPIRLLTYPIMFKGRLELILQVGKTMEGSEEIFHALFFIYLFGAPVLVILAGVIGWFLAGKVLMPVDKITQTARKIGAKNLNERISIPGPKDEIGRLAETFNDMIARLEGSFKSTKQFTADASHELKTPLTIMKGEIEVALRGERTTEGLRTVMLSILEEIDRMSYIVKNLLDIARVDADKDAFSFQDIRLDLLIKERFEQHSKRAIDKGLDLRVTECMPVSIVGDPVRLGQVVFNLIDNAIKYTTKGGEIVISLEADNEWAIIKVHDTGVGISNEDQPNLFDRFYRVDKARTRSIGGGVGLGLSICKEIVNAHAGKINLESELGKGSTFIVYLPLMR